jgi:hypothetical protein
MDRQATDALALVVINGQRGTSLTMLGATRYELNLVSCATLRGAIDRRFRRSAWYVVARRDEYKVGRSHRDRLIFS